MGTYRFVLAAAVIYFHLGGGSWVIGRVAVAAFFIVSGYVIFRVVDSNYGLETDGILRFYANRVLRLAPLFLLITSMTYLWIWARGSNELPFEDGSKAFFRNTPAERSYFDSVWTDLQPRVSDADGIHVLTFSPDNLPQGWSIGVEICFYIIAPLVVWFFTKSWVAGVGVFLIAFSYFVYAVATTYDFSVFENQIYKNVWTMVWMFIFGGMLYWLSKRVKWRLRFTHSIALQLIFIWWMVRWSVPPMAAGEEPSLPILFVGYAVILIVSGLVVFTARPQGRSSRVDTFLGDLSYGMYLNHFLLAAWMVWVNVKVEENFDTGFHPVFGRLNQMQFGVLAIILSALFAWVTFIAIERPVQVWRKRVRPHKLQGRPEVGPVSPVD